MQNVMFTANPLDTSAWELHQVSDIYTFLQEKLPEWPPSARIYREHVAESHDVTPTCEADVNALGDMDNLYVVVYPADPASIIISVVLSAAITAAAFLLRRDPEFPVDEQRVASSNNSLSGRSNKSRLNGRIPDIFGKIRSLPDLIAVPYRTYEDNQEVETAYLCVGRGQYEIPVDTVREGDTPINQIVGSSAVIYGPNASPNGGSVQATIGAAIADAVLSVVEANQVNGQVLNPPNDAAVIGTNNIRFTFPNIIELLAGANLDFTEKFANNDVLAITNAAFTGSIDNGVFTESMRFVSPNIIEFQTFDPSSNFQANDVIALFNTGSYTGPRKDLVIEIDDNMTFALDGTITVIGGGGFSGYLAGDNVVLLNAQYDDGSTAVDLDGTYEIATAPGGTTITLVSPATVNSDWNLIDNYAGDVTGTVNGVETTVNRPQGNLTTQLQGNYTISSVTPTTIVLSNPENVAAGWTNLTEYPNDRTEFETHDVALSGGNKSVNLNGSYTALSVSSNQITLDNPAGTNADWNELADYIADSTDYISPTISSSGDRWIGPFNVEVDTLEQIFTNFVARRGLYSIDDGGQQRSLAVEVELEVDSLTNGVPDGNPELFQVTINGSATLRTLRAATIRANPTFSGPMQIRARRITERDLEFDGTITDEIEWERAYGISPVSQSDFGDITTIHTRTRATSGALAVRRRELNAVVTRRVGLRISGDTFDTVLTATQDAAEILAAVLRDPVIGNRPVSQIDVDNIYDTIAEVETHFGTALARQFNYSFDETDFSLEQTIASIATACFCTAYRQGNIIKVSFEKATVDSTLLFNHRNKLPGSENRVVSFGRQNNHDGVELTYIDPNDGSTLYYLIPNDNTATNPRRVQTVGIGSQEQAYYHAWRAWNKIRYQNTTTQFTATQEAAATILLDRILVADNTRSDVQDGQVVRINGLLITTSQPVTFEGGETYTVFLQNTDGTVDVRVATEVIGNQINLILIRPRLIR